ncbi:MAG: BON domain-containing protein [Acidimicrobiia bacterium]|nr:BON domain-containing protein [Acidimicrobiia bacterium]
MAMMPWAYPESRYYYDWWGEPWPEEVTDGEIKSIVVDRLRENPYTKDHEIKVDVKQGVVILGGEVSSWLAKRAAGDDAWDTPGVVDVSNQLVPIHSLRT